jgi:magnesium chelatase accessory protein
LSSEAAPLIWERDGRAWPNRAASHFAEAAGMRWHVQTMGRGPAIVLLHGTGSSTHSWRDLAPLLAVSNTVVAADLPGHAFTAAPPGDDYSLVGMSAAVGQLLNVLQIKPHLLVGHSAGAAIACRMSLDGLASPASIVSLNGALVPFGGAAAALFSPLAKLLAANVLTQRFFAWRARDRSAIEQVLAGTGSRLDAQGTELYVRLVRDPKHVRAALGMMAQWDLDGFAPSLRSLTPRLSLVVGTHDYTVPASQAHDVQKMLPAARIVELAGLGHLAHEEDAPRVAGVILQDVAAA